MRNLIDIKLLLIAFVSFIFVTCNSEDVIDDIANETANDDIVGASLGKYQQLNFEEALFFVNEIKPEKPSHEGDGLGTLNASSDFLVGVDANSLVFEDVENTKHKIPTLKAQLKNPQVESTAFLVKVQDSVLGFLINAAEDKSIGDEKFSGIVGITDLSGNFVNGYRLKNGEFVSQFVVSKDQKSKDSVGATKRSLSFTAKTVAEEMPRWDCWIYSDSQLDEVSVYGKRGNISNIGRRVSNRGVSVRGGSFSGPTTGRFGAGGGGTGSSSGSDPSGSSGSEAEIFPCDDPLHGCDTNFAEEEDDEIINELTGKALCVYDMLEKLSGGFKNMIQKFDGDFPVSHLKFEEALLSGTKKGRTIAPNSTGVTTSPDYVITIQINSSNNAYGYNQRPNLLVAKTIAHEVIHAEMYRKLLSVLDNGGNIDGVTRQDVLEALDGNYPGMYDYYRRHKNWQHAQMATHYREILARMLQGYDTGIAVADNQQPAQLYMDLAWEGLIYENAPNAIPTWTSLPETEKQRIRDVISNYITNNQNETCTE